MIKYNLKALKADKEFTENRRISLKEISEATGISYPTLSKIANHRGYDTAVSNIEKLCLYFGCTPEKFITIVSEKNLEE